DYMVIPLRARSYSDALHDAVTVCRAMKDVLKSRGVFEAGVADEGGYAPVLASNETGFELMVEAFERADLKPGKDAAIAVDVAASQFGNAGTYVLSTEGVKLESAQWVEKLAGWAGRYPIISIEDGMSEGDWAGWKTLTERLGSRCQLLGD